MIRIVTGHKKSLRVAQAQLIKRFYAREFAMESGQCPDNRPQTEPEYTFVAGLRKILSNLELIRGVAGYAIEAARLSWSSGVRSSAQPITRREYASRMTASRKAVEYEYM
jgi:hypothetical protein